MTAVPIISGVLGVAGIIQQNNAQNAQIAQQNAQINAQIMGNKRLLEMKQVQNNFERQILKAQDQVGGLLRRANYDAQVSQLQVAGEQSNRQTRNDISAIQNTQGQFANQIEAGRQQALSARNESTNALTQELSQMYQQYAQQQQEVQQGLSGAVQNQRQQRRELGALSAQLAALGGQGRSRSAQVRLTPDIEEALQAIEQGRQIDSELQQRIIQSNEFADLYREIANSNYALQLDELNGVLSAADRESQAAIAIENAQNEQMQNNLRTAQEAAGAQYRVENAQARLNRLFADTSLISQGQLSAAQTAAQNSYLESQRQSQQSAFLPILSTLLQTGMGVYAASQPQPTLNIPQSPYTVQPQQPTVTQRPSFLGDVIGTNRYTG